MGPTANIVQRIEVVEDLKNKEIERLRIENAELRKLLDSQLGKSEESK